MKRNYVKAEADHSMFYRYLLLYHDSLFNLSIGDIFIDKNRANREFKKLLRRRRRQRRLKNEFIFYVLISGYS